MGVHRTDAHVPKESPADLLKSKRRKHQMPSIPSLFDNDDPDASQGFKNFKGAAEDSAGGKIRPRSSGAASNHTRISSSSKTRAACRGTLLGEHSEAPQTHLGRGDRAKPSRREQSRQGRSKGQARMAASAGTVERTPIRRIGADRDPSDVTICALKSSG
jgi:hypothetical protein